MLRERDRLIQMQMLVVDCLIIICAFAASYYLRIWMPKAFPAFKWRAMLLLRYYTWIPLLAIPLWLLSFSYFGGMRWIEAKGRGSMPLSVLRPLVVCAVTMALINLVFKPHTVSRVMLGVFFVLCFLSFCAARLVALHFALSEKRAIRNLLIVGGAENAEDMAMRLSEHAEGAFCIVGIATRTKLANEELSGVPVLGTIVRLQEILDQNVIDDVIFSDPLSDLEETEEAIRTCEEVGIDIHLQADFFNVILSKTTVEQVDGLPFLTYSSAPRFAGPLLIKRLMDVIISFASLVLLSPFFGLIAVLIKSTSPGPIIFRQRRAGLNGRELTVYKFRSMYADAEQKIDAVAGLKTSDGPSFKAKDDPRVTKVGRLLRRLSLDELPQLWNVLKGDMSIVGPRPVPMSEVAKYERWQRRRLSMKPGITCLWQVSGRSDLAFSQWMRLDLRYIDQWSLWLDLKIILLTIPAVIRGKGSY